MAQFRYRAVSASGEMLQGEMEAASVEDVVARLQDQGHTPLEAVDAASAGGGSLFARWFRRGPLSGDQLAQFTHQLATLIGAGQPLDRALTTLLELPEGERAQHLIERVRDRVRGGATLSQAFADEHGVFPRVYVSLVRAGEVGGTLHETLGRLAEHLERANELRGSVINALIYPAFLLAGVLGSLLLLLAYVVPQFVPIFADMGVPVPWVTGLVLGIGTFVRAWWWLVVVVVVAVVGVLRMRLRDPAVREAFDGWLLRVRVLGPLLQKLETARIARTLGTLLHSGVPLLSSLNIVRQVSSNRALEAALAAAAAKVKDGAALAPSLAETERLPRLALQMIQVGEEAGELDSMLLKVADTFDSEARRSVDRLLAALVPALTVVMTLLVAFIMSAILMPLMSLTNNMG